MEEWGQKSKWNHWIDHQPCNTTPSPCYLRPLFATRRVWTQCIKTELTCKNRVQTQKARCDFNFQKSENILKLQITKLRFYQNTHNMLNFWEWGLMFWVISYFYRCNKLHLAKYTLQLILSFFSTPF